MMIKRIWNIILLSTALLSAVSCLEEEAVEMSVNESIILQLESPGTKAVADNETESYINSLDVFIFKADENNAKGTRVYYDRYEVNNSGSLTLNCKRSEFDPDDRFFVYLVANTSFTKEELASQTTYAALLNNRQKDEYIHHSGLTSANAPRYFLMDALATDEDGHSPLRLNDGVAANNTILKGELRRAAAKVEITINAGENVFFHHFRDDLESEGGLYYISNLPCDAFILSGEDVLPATATLRNTPKGSSAYFGWHPETDPKKVTLIAYVYPHTWKDASLLDYETCVVVNLPMKRIDGEEEVDYKNSWFKIPMTNTSSFERNHYYSVNIRLNRPGAAADTNPQTFEYIYYDVQEWTPMTVSVGGAQGPEYLQLNTDHVDMYNVNTDDFTLEFASSSFIPADGIELLEAYYYNYLDEKVDLSRNDEYGVYGSIKATAEQNALNGGINIVSPFVAMTRAEMDAEIAKLVKPTPVPEPAGKPKEVENPNNDAKLNEIASRYRRTRWRRSGDRVIFERNGNGSSDYQKAQQEYDDLKANYDKYLIALEDWSDSNPEYAAYLKAQEEYEAAVVAIESSSKDCHGNAIRYMRFRVTNVTGQTAEFTVTQSPTLYITNEHGYYSYRSDFGGTTYEKKGNPNYAGADWATNKWQYTSTASNNNLFASKYAATSGSSYDIKYYYWDNNTKRSRDIGGLNNPRMYHVHVTATSALYTVAIPRLDADGYTLGNSDNSKLVSPSFMIASQLGATQSPSSVTVAASHCKEYVEVTRQGDIYEDWRLPTEAEVNIILNHQYASDAMAEVLSGKYYWCAYTADGKNYVQNKNTSSTSNNTAVRCVRDNY